MPQKPKMQVGDVYGELKILKLWRTDTLPHRRSKCEAECLLCGRIKGYYADNILSGKTTTCGCRNGGKIKKRCIICGKMFECCRSDNKVTCSDACRCARLARQAHKNPHGWSDEARQKRKIDPDVQRIIKELQPKAVKVAQAMPESQRGEQNRLSKFWILLDPDGNQVPCVNLRNWARENYWRFEPETTDIDATARRIAGGFGEIANCRRNPRSGRRSVYKYKGWGLLDLPVKMKK